MPPDAFHLAEYHYRRTPVLIVSVILTAICAPLLLLFIRECFAAPLTPQRLGIALFLISILGVMTFVGVTLLRYYLNDHRLPLVIDINGVSYGGRHFPWTDVRALRTGRKESANQLLLLRRGWLTPDRPLMTDDGITDDEFWCLMELLQSEVAPLYPHLDFE